MTIKTVDVEFSDVTLLYVRVNPFSASIGAIDGLTLTLTAFICAAAYNRPSVHLSVMAPFDDMYVCALLNIVLVEFILKYAPV